MSRLIIHRVREPETSTARMAAYEIRHGLSSEEFHRRWSDGENIPDGMTRKEARRWATECWVNRRARERLAALKEPANRGGNEEEKG